MTGRSAVDQERERAYRSAFYSTLLYVGIAAVWILFSDVVMVRLVRQPEWVARVSIVKGWVFVLLTGFLLLVLQRRHADRIIDAERQYRHGLEEAEEQKRAFFKGTIAAITEGKLHILDPGEIERLLPPASREIRFVDASQISAIRQETSEAAARLGVSEERVSDFVVAVGEALTNAVKHASGGVVSLHPNAEHLWVRVADCGTGIADLMLPRVVLERGYSTKPSLGMGYTLMLALANRVYLSTGPTGTTVVLELCRMQQPDTGPCPPLDSIAEKFGISG